MGRVERLLPGKDGLIRTVVLKTKKGLLRRPVQRLHRLEASSTQLGSGEFGDSGAYGGESVARKVKKRAKKKQVTRKPVSSLQKYWRGIATGRGPNRNEVLHRWIDHLLSGSRVGARLAYALLMIVFDRINHKDRKSSSVLPEETRVLHERLKFIERVHSTTSQIFEKSDEIFGIGLETLDKRELTNELTEPQREPGNLMVLPAANFLKSPIVIFLSLENFPTIPILPRQQSHGMPSLFISFNASGCGHYDYVCRENCLSEPEEKIGEEIKKKEKRAKVFCSCGVSRKGQGSVANICNNVIGLYSSRCKCLKARVTCSGGCTCRGCSNPLGEHPSESANTECGAPRKRRKYDFQNLKKHTSQAYLHMKGEPPRGGALTREESFVVEELIQLSLASGKELKDFLSVDPLRSC
ncbi:hypothetical protein AWC38_SpisGene8116 [Stylophora pistillata]|uniref:DUF5641 domain-containing protein n=1 Tax=Stylophora pistillata TaxID=50429 RepID=A0A2B4SFE6_STYPI|nr:hypothetical protein AWC38_SpisGene8116 [Stylophora pistillata]